MKLILFIFLAVQINTANIVTIGSCITQIVCELGRCNQIVATDKQSQRELEQPVTNIGYWRSINVETILQSNPTLILASKTAGPPRSIQVFESTSNPVVLINKTENWDDLMSNISLIASK